MRVLIIDDDLAMGDFLQDQMRTEGHETSLVQDTDSGLHAARDGAHDLILLDISQPDVDDLILLEDLRDLHISAYIMALTCHTASAARIAYLDLGADDVLAKPFSFLELKARCRALTRRQQRFADRTLREGDLELNRLERKVARSGKPIDLTTKEFALLEYLMLARGRTCSRGELLKEVWRMSPDAGTNVVDVYVNYLRRKLGAGRQDGLDGGESYTSGAVIDTIRGEGYSLALGLGRRPGQTSRAADANLAPFPFSIPRKPHVYPSGRLLYA